MARKRTGVVGLPPNVHAVKAKGHTYYYFQRNRGTAQPGERIPLGKDLTDPEFWKRHNEAAGIIPESEKTGTIARMIAAWKTSPEWRTYSEATQRDYTFYADKIETAWGREQAKAIKPKHALALRDKLSDSPGSANHLIVVGKTLWKWGIPREFASENPFREIAGLSIEDDGHRPWPQWALDYVEKHAYPDLARFVYLAVQTGQRESDVVRFGASAVDGGGLWVRPIKTRKKRKAFWVPLLKEARARVASWQDTPVIFDLIRRKQPLAVGPCETYVFSPRGSAYTTEGLRSRWNRWLVTEAGKEFAAKWDKWERALRERDGEEIPADEELRPTLHGLRSTAVVTRRLAGYKDEDVSNDIGMSLPMVRRYSRFIDQRAAAENNIVLLEERMKKSAAK
jgi:integrase